ncbi:MAG: hypothetical protein JSW43_05980 [Gemmatimonadota bacterium]|nr:MAG: hypothetical protein JSW43_05980 [Gemmatimonadota bacterium]
MEDWAIMVMVMNSVFIVSGAGIFGYWLKLRHERRHLPGVAQRLEEMRQLVGELQEQLDAQTAELHERLDVAERMLTRGLEPRNEGSPATPI